MEPFIHSSGMDTHPPHLLNYIHTCRFTSTGALQKATNWTTWILTWIRTELPGYFFSWTGRCISERRSSYTHTEHQTCKRNTHREGLVGAFCVLSHSISRWCNQANVGFCFIDIPISVFVIFSKKYNRKWLKNWWKWKWIFWYRYISKNNVKNKLN